MTTATTRTLDYEAMRRDIRRKIEGPPRMTYRSAAAQIGDISATALNQVVLYNRAPEYGHYLGICEWLEVPPEKYAGRATPQLAGLDYLDAILMQDPKLTRPQAEALSDMLRAAYKAVAQTTEGVQNESLHRPTLKYHAARNRAR